MWKQSSDVSKKKGWQWERWQNGREMMKWERWQNERDDRMKEMTEWEGWQIDTGEMTVWERWQIGRDHRMGENTDWVGWQIGREDRMNEMTDWEGWQIGKDDKKAVPCFEMMTGSCPEDKGSYSCSMRSFVMYMKEGTSPWCRRKVVCPMKMKYYQLISSTTLKTN